MSDLTTYDILAPGAKAAASIRDDIRQGNYAVGERLPNERDLAERFGISRGTLRQALKILEDERLISRQQGRGTFIANVLHAAVPSDTRTALIAAIVYERESYFNPILNAASLQAASAGYVLTTGSNDTPETETQHLTAFLRSGVQGALMSPVARFSLPGYQRLREGGIHVVLIDTLLPGCEEDFVSVDNRIGTMLAVRHLIELGHRRIGYVTHNYPLDIPCRDDRLAGFFDSTRADALRIDHVIEADPEQYQASILAMLQSRNRPTGIVCFNDIWALRVASIARELGLRLPQDLSIVGFDDHSMARNYDIPITTIHPQFREVGIHATNLLIEKIERPRQRPTMTILIRPQLIVRDSTAKPRK